MNKIFLLIFILFIFWSCNKDTWLIDHWLEKWIINFSWEVLNSSIKKRNLNSLDKDKIKIIPEYNLR